MGNMRTVLFTGARASRPSERKSRPVLFNATQVLVRLKNKEQGWLGSSYKD